MPRATLLAAFFAAACASSGTSPRLAVGIMERYASDQQSTEVGEHVFTIEITNHSADAVTIESIRIDIAGTSDYQMDSPTVSVSTPIGAEETQEFEVPGVIELAPRRSRTVNYRVDSLAVTISGTGAGGSFIDSGTYPIRRQRSQ